MRILVDANDPALPSHVLRVAADLRGGASVERSSHDLRLLDGGPAAESAAEVDRSRAEPMRLAMEQWAVQAHAYAKSEAAKAGFLGKLFAGEATRVQAGVVHEAKRFSIVHTSQGVVEVGAAVRLCVATSKANASIELTLPNLAADAQLHRGDTRVGITVAGYTGPLGSLLPAPRKLDVETYVEYVDAFQRIQALIFGEEGRSHVAPVPLAYEIPDIEAGS